MFRRRSIKVCREGIYYLLVLIFVVGGATLQDINLLFVLAGLMIGPLIYNWRMASLSVRWLAMRRVLPEYAFAGQPFRVEIEGENLRYRMGSWMLVIEDFIESDPAEDNPISGIRIKAGAIIAYLGAKQVERTSYQLTLPRRGRYRFGPLLVSTRFPLGLVKATARLPQSRRMIVGPKLGTLTPQWLQLMDSRRFGRQQAQYRQGPIDGDYYGLREWRAGDSKRWIHWRTAAKLGQLAVRQFEQQQDRDLALILDLWAPGSPSDEQRGNVELAVSLTATVINHLTRRARSHLTVCFAARPPRTWSSRATAVFGRQMMERLAMARASSNDSLSDLLNSVVLKMPSGARVLVISTRSDELNRLQQSGEYSGKMRHQSALSQVNWIDVGAPQLDLIFQLPSQVDAP
ncbi:MAG: DUF58 domain-containing protein [Planctomycetaceae bacterium]|nr:MAG: DUF58 domain-containing protein [Planctomycetaceae bacterium]